jgi:hypothetical protein
MSRYAVVMPDSTYLPGVHGFLNGLLYYGHQDLDFHLIYTAGNLTGNELAKGTFDFYPHLYPVELGELRPDFEPRYPHLPELNWTWMMHFYRYLYVADRMQDYDAVLIVDSDMQVLNNLMPYFEWAAATDRFLIPNNDLTCNEYDACRLEDIGGGASPPLCNMPIFVRPSRAAEVFRAMPAASVDHWLDDMAALCHVLLETGEMANVAVLPALLWLPVHTYVLPFWRRTIGGIVGQPEKHYLCTHEGGDRLNLLHRRWWEPATCTEYGGDGSDTWAAQTQRRNVRLFNWFTRFFNLECTHAIEWRPEWAVIE